MTSFPKGRLLLTQWTSVSACLKCRSQFPVSSASFLRSSFSSKTPINSSTLPAVSSKVAPATSSSTAPPPPTPKDEVEVTVISDPIPVFSGVDIRQANEETRIKLHKASAEVAAAQSYSITDALNPKRRKEILIMEEEAYKHTMILEKRPPLLDRRAENNTFWDINKHIDQKNRTDQMVFLQQDIDIRPQAIRRFIEKTKRDKAISEQSFKPKRNEILGNDLACAHMVVANKGKVKFLQQTNWVTQYRKDAKEGVPEEDLPVMKHEFCTLPTKYDPRWRVEAVDLAGFQLYYEGLATFENLNYLRWISMRDQQNVDDWCLDRISRMFNETLEYIDLSGCKLVTDRGIGALHRCRNLKAIRVENMPHLEDLEIVCAMLEDHNPNLQVIGVDYEGKMEQMRLEGEELSRKILQQQKEQPLLESTEAVDQESSKKKEQSPPVIEPSSSVA